MRLEDIDTKTLQDELNRRKLTPGVWTVIKFIRDEETRKYYAPQPIHLIEDSNGIQTEIQVVGIIYDKILNDKQPETSDEDSSYDSDWEDYEEFSINYFIGKQIQIDSFHPLKISKIL